MSQQTLGYGFRVLGKGPRSETRRSALIFRVWDENPLADGVRIDDSINSFDGDLNKLLKRLQIFKKQYYRTENLHQCRQNDFLLGCRSL